MATPFSRITRSLNTSGLRTAAVGMIIAVMLLTIWCAWFFTARISICETSQKAWMTNTETITLEFPENETRPREMRQKIVMAEFFPKSGERIRTGQSASLRLERGMGKPERMVRAVVTKVSERSQNKPVQVELAARFDPDDPAHLRGQVRIEVEQVTPADLVMRTSGVFADMPGDGPRNHDLSDNDS